MISYQRALQIIAHQFPATGDAGAEGADDGCERVSTAAAVGRVAAEDIFATIDLQPFDNSAMDGFAVRHQEVTSGAPLLVAGGSAAGDAPQPQECEQLGAWEIMTGAAIPSGYDTVIPVEQVSIVQRGDDGRPSIIEVLEHRLGQHVRYAGEDMKAGDVVLRRNQIISPGAVMVLTSQGIAEVNVRQQIRAAVVTTGSELVEARPNAKLSPGKIWNSNGPYLAATLTKMGIETRECPCVGDSISRFIAAIEQAAPDCEIIISTGAVSMGRYDFVPTALEQLGARIAFHKVAVRPGKPALYARLPDGTHFFGLAGNPASTACGLRFFVTPLINHLLGAQPSSKTHGILTNSYRKNNQLTQFLKARRTVSTSGVVEVEICAGQESFKVAPLLHANGWVIAGEQTRELKAGEIVEFVPDFT